MSLCNICNDTLINPITRNQCSCVIKNSLKKAMNPILLETESLHKQLYFPHEHLDKFKSIICTIKKPVFNSICKYYFSLEYIMNGGRYTHIYSSAKDLVDTFMSDSEEDKKAYAEADVLFLTVSNDPENVYMSQVIPWLVERRSSFGKKTWINVSQKVYDSRATVYKGMINTMLEDGIVSFVSSFRPIGWSSK